MLKVSIIIPVYKVESYIHRCLDSILNQSYYDWECLLIDDGSPDNSGKVCDEYVMKDSRFRVFHVSNGGVSKARNIGLDNIKGDWLMFVDSDDAIAPNTLSICVETGKKNKLDLIQFSFCRDESDYNMHNGVKTCPMSVDDYIRERKFLVCVGGNMFKSKFIQDNNLRFDERLKYAEDQVFFYNYINYINLAQRIDEQLYFYFINNQSATRTRKNTEDLINSIDALVLYKWKQPALEFFIDRICVEFLYNLATNNDISIRNIKALVEKISLNDSTQLSGSYLLFFYLLKVNVFLAVLFARIKF